MRCSRVVLTGLLIASAVAAADPPPTPPPAEPAFDPNAMKFVFGDKAALAKVKTVEWHAQIEAGGLATTGNSDTLTASGAIHLSRLASANKLSLDASAAYARQSLRVIDDKNGNGMIDDSSEIAIANTVTTEIMQGKLRYDRFLTSDNSLYIAALAARDLPAGKQSVFGGQAGYARQLYKSKQYQASAELGYDFSRENDVTGPPLEIHSARAFIGFKGTMTEGTTLDTSVELLTNLNKETLVTGQSGGVFEDTRLNGHIAITAKLSKSAAFQTSFEFHYDHRPSPLKLMGLAPGFVPAAEPLDTITKASLIYSFF